MKKLILASIFSLYLSVGFSQEGTPSTSTDTTKSSKFIYCAIVGTAKFLNPNQINLTIDYGQEKSIWKDNRVKDENGKIQTFNSMVDALNYMGSQGWEFVQAYTVTLGNQNVYHYLLKKSKV